MKTKTTMQILSEVTGVDMNYLALKTDRENKEWVAVKDLEIYLDNKIKQVMGRTQEEGKKKVIIYCLENMKQELKNE